MTSDPDGKSYKGIRIAPHIYSKNLKADVLTGVDKTLEWPLISKVRDGA
jgi:hypothetical protein